MGLYRSKIRGCFFLCIALLPGVLMAGDITEKPVCRCESVLDQGIIDWTTGRIRVSGKASPPVNDKAMSADAVVGAAKADANRNLIAILKKLVPESGKKTGNAAMEEIRLAGIEKTANDARIVDQHYTSDCAMEIVLETSLLGGFLQLVLPEEIGEIPTIEAIRTGVKDSKLPTLDRVPYTGLVVDARGIDFQPVIYPVIVSELGDPIYSAMFISREYAVHHGVCQYVCCMDSEVTVKRVGVNPMVIKALRKGGERNTAIVISRSDAEQIEKATEFHSFMRQCNVVIVLDQ